MAPHVDLAPHRSRRSGRARTRRRHQRHVHGARARIRGRFRRFRTPAATLDRPADRPEVIDVSDARFQKGLAPLDRAVATNRARFASPVGTRTSVFTDIPVGPSIAVTNTFRRLEQMAIAWSTPGSAYLGDAALLQEVIAGLEDTNRLFYNDTQVRPQPGNWWDYQVCTTPSTTRSRQSSTTAN